MESIAIGVREPSGLCAELTSALQPLRAAGARLRLQEVTRGEIRFVGCQLESGAGVERANLAFREAVASAVAAFIVGPQEAQLLRRLTASRYGYFTESERERICILAARQLASGGGGPGAEPPPGGDGVARGTEPPAVGASPAPLAAGARTRIRETDPGRAGAARAIAGRRGSPGSARPASTGDAIRGVRQTSAATRPASAPRPPAAAGAPRVVPADATRQKDGPSPAGAGAPGCEAPPRADWSEAGERRRAIVQRIGEYLERHDTLVVDGFVTFRLKEYVDEMAVAVDRAVDDFLLDREYREFIGLLRYFVESQADRPVRADCILTGEGGFILQDEGGRPLGTDFLHDVGPGAVAGVGPEDLMVSALITVAPRAVRLHLPDGRSLSADALASLREVFAGHVEICRGCPECARSRPG